MREILTWLFGFIKRHSVLVRLAVVLVLFALLLHNIQPVKIITAFGQAKSSYLIYGLVLMIPNFLLQIFKWDYILRTLSPRPSFRSAAVSVLGGFFLGAVSPARTGEFARGIFMPGQSLVRIASLTVVDKGFNQATVVILGLFSLGLLLPWPLSITPFLVGVFVIGVLYNLYRLKPGLESFLHRFTHSERVDNALAAFDALSPNTVAGMICFSIVFYLIYAAQFYLMLLAFVHVPLITALKTLPVVYLINLILPVSFGHFGVKEIATVKLLTPFGISGVFVFSATLTNNVITFLLPGIVTGIMVAFYRHGKK